MSEHKHQPAINLIRKEISRLGAELFEEELINLALQVNSKEGDKKSQEDLSMRDFVGQLFGGREIKNEKEKRIMVLMDSIVALDMKGWQPIETAPKDGRKILLTNKCDEIAVAHWDDVSMASSVDKGWQICCIPTETNYYLEMEKATHWMPLPELPDEGE